MRGKLDDLTGRRYGKLIVLSMADKPENANGSYWKCKCDCGEETVVSAKSLKCGDTKSCGCMKYSGVTTHGLYKTRLHGIWILMRDRCNNPNSPNYKRYGGRGIKVCETWSTFKPFYDWAIQNGYGENLSLDRIDNNGDYAPSNCRWTTRIEQANNTRRSRFIEFNGETHTLAEWARIYKIPYDKLWARLSYGWSIERALCE